MSNHDRLGQWIFDWFTRKWLPANFKGERQIEYFRQAQANGYHILPNSYYTPIPDTSKVPDTLWEEPSAMPGVAMNDERQIELDGPPSEWPRQGSSSICGFGEDYCRL